MDKELNFIINDNKLEKRTEKSKYFTEEFFKKCGIKKYRYLLEDYNFIDFERDTYCRRGETKNPEEDYYIDGLWLEDSNYKIYILYGNFDLKGAFFIDENNTSFIFLRKGLSPQEEINILIHEFGHFMLHKQYLLNRRS